MAARKATPTSARKPKRKPNALESLFEFYAEGLKLPPFVREHKFAKDTTGRLWRFDFCWPEYQLAVEIEGLVIVGGQFGKGRHNTPSGFRGDLEKYNTAVLLGWRVLRFEQAAVKSGNAAVFTERVLKSLGWQP